MNPRNCDVFWTLRLRYLDYALLYNPVNEKLYSDWFVISANYDSLSIRTKRVFSH